MNDPGQKPRADAIRNQGPRDLVVHVLKKFGYFVCGKDIPLLVHLFIFPWHASTSRKYLDIDRTRTKCLQHLNERKKKSKLS